MSKIVLGILTGILIFIAAGLLATHWVGKMRREMEEKRPQLAMMGCARLGFPQPYRVVLKYLE